MSPVAGPPALDEFRTPRPIAGWRVVATAFWLAVFAWGLGFYSLSLYVHQLGEAGWSGTLLSAATTGYFLLGAAAIQVVERAAAAFGRRRVALRCLPRVPLTHRAGTRAPCCWLPRRSARRWL